jgi:hypothetical protein
LKLVLPACVSVRLGRLSQRARQNSNLARFTEYLRGLLAISVILYIEAGRIRLSADRQACGSVNQVTSLEFTIFLIGG